LIVDRKDLRVLVTSPDWPIDSSTSVSTRRGSTAFDSGSTTTSTTRPPNRGARTARRARRARTVHALRGHARTPQEHRASHRRSQNRVRQDSRSRLTVLVGPVVGAGRDGGATVVVWCRANCYWVSIATPRRRVRPTRRRVGTAAGRGPERRTRVVASATTPSVASNERVVRVDHSTWSQSPRDCSRRCAKATTTKVKPLDVNRWPISRGATSPSITWWRGDETALDVSPYPPPRRAVATSVNWRPGSGHRRRDDAGHAPRRHLRWHDCRRRRTSPRSSQRPAHSTALRGVGGGRSSRRDRLTCGTRRTTRCRVTPRRDVVTIHTSRFSRTRVARALEGAVLSSSHRLRGDHATCSSPSVSSPLVNWTSRFPSTRPWSWRRSALTSSASAPIRVATRTLARARLSGRTTLHILLGTFEPRKGIDVLLDAFEEIATVTTTWSCGWPDSRLGVKEIEARSPLTARVRGFVASASSMSGTARPHAPISSGDVPLAWRGIRTASSKRSPAGRSS